MSCFQVISSNIVSYAFIFPLIHSFVFLPSSETLADRLNASISVPLILLIAYDKSAVLAQHRCLLIYYKLSEFVSLYFLELGFSSHLVQLILCLC